METASATIDTQAQEVLVPQHRHPHSGNCMDSKQDKLRSKWKRIAAETSQQTCSSKHPECKPGMLPSDGSAPVSEALGTDDMNESEPIRYIKSSQK